MNIKYFLSFLMLLSGLIAAAQNNTTSNFSVMIENQSRFNLAETIDKVSKTVLENGWKITITHDLQETMKKNNKEVLPVKVMELCNPGLAFRILSKDDLRNVSPMLPCRISIYEKSDGKTYISRMNAPAFANMIGGDAAKTVVQAFDEVERFLKTVVE